jgi:hypothetical protein
MSKSSLLLFALAAFLFAGCASVPMAPTESSNQAKEFKLPPEGKSGLYIYRGGGPGTALKKDILVDDECLGESAPNVYFYKQVEGDKEHKISTESEFSPNDLLVKVKSGFNYFVRQYIKFGVFVGGANLELVDEEQGKKDISNLEMAMNGTCGK